DEPLLTITHALQIIYAGEANPHTIHLANGIYSPSQTGETFPLYCQSYLSFQGEDENTTILDGEGLSNILYCYNDNNFTIEDMTIQNGNTTSYPNRGGGIYCENSAPNLVNVKFCQNTAYKGAGLYLLHSNPTLTKVTINNNTANYSGGGIFCNHSYPNLINVTISGNTANDNGGGIYCYSGSHPSLENCILWDNIPQEIYIFSDSVTVTYSNIQGGWTGQGNIDADPLFADPQNGDFHLTWANFPIPDSTMSPCIDTGDPNSPLDPDGTIADMGAYYYDQGTGTENSQFSIFNFQLMNYPNPFNPAVAGAGRSPGTTISFSLAKDVKYAETCPTCRIVIYNIKGQKIRELKIENLKLKINEVVWNGTDENNQPVSSGIYFYSLKIDNKTISIKKCLLIK
ncbi:MAG: right-handed parallel beta-helix repeat-containing protein, partial [Candidatus Cloacimonetes bacterium]|nr:right-handed parallel beta-helix repeat-containing protein [Candidatus Cloacimonadota bacterium]